MLPQETQQAIITFLISVGTLAASELRQRWALKRKEQKSSVDLSKEDVSEQEVSTTVGELLASRNEEDIRQTLDLVQRRRKLI